MIDPSTSSSVLINSSRVICVFQITNSIPVHEVGALLVCYAKATTVFTSTSLTSDIVALKVAVKGPHSLTVSTGLPVMSFG